MSGDNLNESTKAGGARAREKASCRARSRVRVCALEDAVAGVRGDYNVFAVGGLALERDGSDLTCLQHATKVQ